VHRLVFNLSALPETQIPKPPNFPKGTAMLKKMLASAACVFLVSVFAGYAATYTPEPSNRLRKSLGDTPWKVHPNQTRLMPKALQQGDAT